MQGIGSTSCELACMSAVSPGCLKTGEVYCSPAVLPHPDMWSQISILAGQGHEVRLCMITGLLSEGCGLPGQHA